jgi:hypothetical protein
MQLKGNRGTPSSACQLLIKKTNHRKQRMKKLMMAAAMLCALDSIAQKKEVKPDSLPAAPKADTAKAGAVKPYDKVITANAVTRQGMFTVHKVEDNYYLEIPDSLLGREILLVNRMGKSSVKGIEANQAQYYAGDQLKETVISFEQGPGHKIFMRSISHLVQGSDTSANGMYRSVLNSSVQPILAAFAVKAYNDNKTASVIDITDLISSDNSILGIDLSRKTAYKMGALQKDRSYIESVRPFSRNIEIRAIKTYASATDATGEAFTFELSNSLVLLPQVPMQPRYADERVGYFNTGYTDFDANPQGVKNINMITRWRLEPKPGELEKYKRGELVEPQQPIVIYIDPATPQKWVPYLILGINDWQKAFEQAGFKNAIIGKEAPTGDSTWSIDDATHSAIVYKPSTTPNAMGPHVHDPRSGEILETHISWYHNVMSLLHDWYFIQAGAVDPKARKMEFDEALMGQLIRFVSSHEVGHTLGLMHNFGSSSTVPVDSLRNKKWVEAHGHTPSIMDYARFNYVAQPEDGISETGIFPRIGDYDKWAVEYGYRLYDDFKDKKEEAAFFNKLIIDSLTRNKRLWYGPQLGFGGPGPDPRSQNEDLGDDAIKAGLYGIKNLKRIMVQLPEYTKTPNEGYGNLQTMYKALVAQFGMYAGHVTANVGGVYINPKTVEDKGEPFLPVPKAKQKQAVAFLTEQVLQTPQWLMNAAITGKLRTGTTDVTALGALNLQFLLYRVVNLQTNIRKFGAANAYSIPEFFNDVKKGVWGELATGSVIETYRRDLQMAYITMMIAIIKEPADKPVTNTQAELIALGRLHVKELQKEIRMAIPRATDIVSKAHLQFANERIENALYPK